MKTALASLSAAALLGAAAFSAQAATRSYDVDDFTEIAARGSYDVVVRSGAGPSVRAEGDEDDLDHLAVRVDGDRLILEHKRRSGLGMFDDHGDVRVLVTVPRLSGANLAGSGDLTIDRMEGESVGLSLAGSGNLKVGALEAERASISIAGSGDVTAGGTCGSGKMSIAGSGDVLAETLTCRTLSVSIAGSGNVSARATESAKVSSMGSGDVTLTGGAECRSSVAGSGEVTCS